MSVEIFDDDARLGDRAVQRLVAQDRHLADRPKAEEIGARHFIGQIDGAVFERRAVLVKRDQHLVAEGGEGMSVKNQRHGSSLQ
ncbi:hypothetical protein AJ87_30515 [Rhizobium yanglingense]|nr:hypothetical protein AJ87_30515 [Rhizobium yanglingense]